MEPLVCSIIKHNVYIETILSNIDNDIYTTMDEFRSDISLMWNNVHLFHGDNSDAAELAYKLEQDLDYFWDCLDEIVTIEE